MLPNHAWKLDRAMTTLAKHYSDDPDILNRPGVSLACKIDPNYYIAPMPQAVYRLSQWAVLEPGSLLESLIRTGALVSESGQRRHELDVLVRMDGKRIAPLRLRAGFLLSGPIETALKAHARIRRPLSLSTLQILASEKAKVERFFAGKTPPMHTAYAQS